MPNWCFTNYAVTGEKEQLDELYNTMKELQELPEPLVPSGFGKRWLGCLVTKLGRTIDGEEGLYCRGDWSELRRDEKGNVLFSTETAWSRMEDVEQLIREKWGGLNIYFISEESGVDLYETNDEAGLFFPDRYIIDIEDEEKDYYTHDEALKTLSEFFGKEVTTWEQACTLAEQWNDTADENETENHVWLHEFDLTE